MKNISIVFILLLIGFSNLLFAQKVDNKKYEIILQGNYKEPLQLDSNLNWYFYTSIPVKWMKRTKIYSEKNNILESCIDTIIKLNPKKDIKWKKIKDDISWSIKGKYKKEDGFLIGTKDTLIGSRWRNFSYFSSFIIRPGEIASAVYQGFRDCSPYLNLICTGNVYLDSLSIKEDLDLITICRFSDFAYHKVKKYGGKVFNKKEEFAISFKKVINDYKKSIGEDTLKTIHSFFVLKMAYIDNDYIIDLLLVVNNSRYLILSNQHDLDNKNIYHVDQLWEDKRIWEF